MSPLAATVVTAILRCDFCVAKDQTFKEIRTLVHPDTIVIFHKSSFPLQRQICGNVGKNSHAATDLSLEFKFISITIQN